MEKFLKLAVAVVLVGGMLLGSNIAFAGDGSKASKFLGFVITPDTNCLSFFSEVESFSVSVFNRGPKKATVRVECEPVEPLEPEGEPVRAESVNLDPGDGGAVLDGVELTQGNATCVVSLTDESPSKKATIDVTVHVFSCLNEKREFPPDSGNLVDGPANASRAFSFAGTIKKDKKEKNDDDDDD